MKKIYAALILTACTKSEDAFIADAADASCACYDLETEETTLASPSDPFQACSMEAATRYRKELEGIECASLYRRDSNFAGDLPLVEACIDTLRTQSEQPTSACSIARDRGDHPREIGFHLREWCHDICKREE